MAGVLVGGSLLSAFLQVVFDRLASRQVVGFFSARKLDEGLLNKLKLKLLSIDALADDAEVKQLSDPRVRQWLFAVKDAVFDAEDLLAEIDYELTRCQVEAAESKSQTFSHKVSNFLNATFSSFNRKIVSEMKQVLDKLEYLDNQKRALGLKGATHSSVGSGSKVSQKLESSSLVAESVIYGREDDKEIIFSWLTSETDNGNRLSLLSIVGMGGLGKTTLVQHVYNDPRMEEAKFDIKAWVCISDDFDVLTVTKAILEAITKSRDDSGSLEMVHGRLKEILTGKKFLLVLDDVWNENQEKWRAVQTALLNCGACGSKILVTTRNEKVASTMRSNEVHHLKQLQEDQCWKVFAKHAFRDDHLESNVELKEIAKKIIEKCKGLPLALKSIGSLLHTKSSISEWKNVLLSNIWDLPIEGSEIIPALFLSYHHLPSHLKRCFAFCALFPKDCVFDKNDLIPLWMAESFLQCSRQRIRPEEIGELYFDDLLSRSFFQQLNRSKQYFVMHDLLHDLAEYVCGDICFRSGVDKAEGITKTTRHFSLNKNHCRYYDDIRSLSNAKRLRTFIQTSQSKDIPYNWSGVISIHDLCSKFKFLHNLSLSYCSNTIEVPDSVGELKYLHSLDLSHTSTNRLPDSICSLYNLQILKLNFCWLLEELPSNLNKLTNLRCLEFRGSRVRKMPVLLEKLKNLQVLSTFCVGKSSESVIQQLGQLGGLNLHGELSIEELQNIVNPTDALATDLKNKTHLVELAFSWNSNHIPNDQRKDREVLENLQPSKYLKHLSIQNYGGTQFPCWLFNNSFSNVVSLRLAYCKYCVILPPFGLLPFLKDLAIAGLDGIVSIGAEFYGTSSSPFPSLETLSFSKMKEWEEWECKVSFPRLQSFSIWRCPKLKEVSEQLFHVKKLDIYECRSMEASFERNGHAVSNNSLEYLSISRCPNMNIRNRCCYDSLVRLNINGSCDSLTTFSLDLFPKLISLDLNECSNLRMITQEHTHNHLQLLYIGSCPQYESFPNEELSAPRLEMFYIKGLEKLKSLPKRMHILLPSLTHLMIHDCPQVEMFSEGGLPSNLKDVRLKSMSMKLIASLKGALGPNTCLHTLYVDNADVECFPEEGLLPLSLTSLCIAGCRNLKKLDYKGLCNLSSLRDLRLNRCPNLECLPEEGLPKSILTLSEGGLPSNLEKVSLWSMSMKLIGSLKGALGPNTCLHTLSIYDADVECFPEEGLLPPSLTSLRIGHCRNIKKLDYKGLCNLSSLEKLSLWDYPNLQCLPEEGLPKSISTLIIMDCPLLQQRCQKPEGGDWEKIAHIQKLDIE